MGEKGVVGSGEREKCGWWIDLPTGDGLAKWDTLDGALREAMSCDSLKRMGENGHELVERKYTWEAVVGAMKHGYEQILKADVGLGLE